MSETTISLVIGLIGLVAFVYFAFSIVTSQTGTRDNNKNKADLKVYNTYLFLFFFITIKNTNHTFS